MKRVLFFRISSILIIGVFFFFINSCSKQDTSIVDQEIPTTNEKKATLGKRLFFDPILSKDGTVSCASCHKPEHGFADDKPVSIGIKGQKGERNTPTIFNAFRPKLLFWDGRAMGLEEQALGPIENPIEMGEDLKNVVNKLNNLPYYKKAFDEVFGKGEITKEKLAEVVAEFERTAVSKDSNYDRYKAGDSSALSESARRGLVLFEGKAMCIACHNGPDFTDYDFHNIGLPITEDVGRAKITQKREDIRKFKTPTLREVARTAPYFHTGEFETLEQVIAYYNAGGGQDQYKDPLKEPLNLTEEEQLDLVEFLKSLTGRQPIIKPPI